MKIIISHDVDHLFGTDHWFRDLIYPKLWVRSALEALKGEISWRECWLRSVSCFQKERHRLRQVMALDRQYGVPSTFFFGMEQGLGMSYHPQEARQIIREVRERGFAVGVHGICYDDAEGIRKERERFEQTAGFPPCGIRMHYVRYAPDTFRYEDMAGYRFDATEFDKQAGGTVKDPYRVGAMWEFPLTIMDVYLPQRFEEARQETIRRLKACMTAGIDYVSILFHDYQLDPAYSDMSRWYAWLLAYLADDEAYSFVSFADAMCELEAKE